jgi:glycosyltransferase involved in cell wall biosynthesis
MIMANHLFDVSVIIPVYNAEEYVTSAVESALQFPEVKEVLLIEDASPDNSLEVCKELEMRYARVKLLQHPDRGNHGAGASRNLGLANASCHYIAFLDADDFYLPNRFEVDKRVFAENPAADGVYNALGVYYYSEHAESIYKSISGQELTTITEYIDSIKLFESFIGLGPGYGHFHLDGLTIKKEILEKIDLWFNPALRLHQDTEFRIRLTYTARLFPGEIKAPTVKRGVHGENRIINIQFDNKQKNIYQQELWNSLYDWAKTKKIPDQYIKQIFRIKLISNLIIHNHIHRCFFFIKQTAKDRSLFLDVDNYNSVHHLLLGNNKVSRLLLLAKNKVQSKLIHRLTKH